uniref:Ras guanyl-releasing protein 3 n=1 Tax=Panagrellus redivivus TaxID=6233 RepID=A0A7E4UNY1_PANRE
MPLIHWDRLNLPSCSSAPPDDHPLDAGGLVRLCVNCFDQSTGEPLNDFPHCLFMIGEWLMETTELMAQFVALYQEECDEFGYRICAAVGYWIRHFPVHFDAHTQLCKLVERLRKMAIDDGLEESVADLDVSSVPSYAWLRNVSVRNPVSRHVSLCFEQWSPEDISTSMSHIDYKVLSRVTIPEVKKYVKSGKLNQTPILERSIAVFNSLSSWVQCMILSKSTPKERADVITKFVNVGKHLRKLHNYNTLMAVIGGVTHSSISRLNKTYACLTPETKADLTSLTNLLSNQSNFAAYRRELGEVTSKFKIPIMGIHLKDLIAWNGCGPGFDKTGTITLKRLFQLAHLLSYFIGINRVAHNFADPNMDLINTLKVSLDISYNDNDIYDLSLKREPRTLLSFQSASKPVVFADWASGVCQTLDAETVNKHVSAMVDAVFKHYDHDKDAYISKEEFEQIVGNFPFIDPFVTIDADRDGLISKSEMTSYFINLNKKSNEFRRGFKHNFHETTLLTPTLCQHCTKMLWGLIRQGYKCKDCGLVVHESCKDVAVAECRRKRQSDAGNSITAWLTRGTASTSTVSNGVSNGTSSPTPGSAVTTPRKGIFLNYSFRPKNRTVSTVSESPSPEPSFSATSEPSVPAFVGNTLRSSFHRWMRPRKNRAKSETVDCYREKYNQSPDAETDNVVSLASEEVFEDDSSTSEPLSERLLATTITRSPLTKANGTSPGANHRFPRGFVHHKIGVGSNGQNGSTTSPSSSGTRLSPTMETHQEMAEVR